MKTPASNRFAPFLTVIAALGLLAACEETNTYVEPPPPKVTVARPLQQKVVDYLEFTGTTAALEEVEVRARVPGFLESMHFTPGTQVEKGDLLFVIDPRDYEAELKNAQAQLARAQAALERAEKDYRRYLNIRKKDPGAASEALIDQKKEARDQAKADIAAYEAAVESAKLKLSYTQVTAPIAGRVSRNLVDMGNLVGQQEPTLLTRITKSDPIYAYFNLNERDLLKVLDQYREAAREKGFDPETAPDAQADIPVFIGLANEEGYSHKGELDYAESSVDPGTGTLQLRAVLPNPGKVKTLLPGLFIRVRLPVGERDNALLVAEQAVGADQGGRYLLTVNTENKVEKKPVRLGRLVGGLRVIIEGIRSDDAVIVNGLQRARPGGKVDPETIEMSSFK